MTVDIWMFGGNLGLLVNLVIVFYAWLFLVGLIVYAMQIIRLFIPLG